KGAGRNNPIECKRGLSSYPYWTSRAKMPRNDHARCTTLGQMLPSFLSTFSARHESRYILWNYQPAALFLDKVENQDSVGRVPSLLDWGPCTPRRLKFLLGNLLQE